MQSLLEAFGLDVEGYYSRLKALLDDENPKVRLEALKLTGKHLGLTLPDVIHEHSQTTNVGAVIVVGASMSDDAWAKRAKQLDVSEPKPVAIEADDPQKEGVGGSGDHPQG